MSTLTDWIEDHDITEVEALIPDMSGSARDKFVPALRYSESAGILIPEAMFMQTVTGDYGNTDGIIGETDVDMRALPDMNTIRMVPWAPEPTAQIIHDCCAHDGTPIEMSPRYVLRRVLERYEAKAWEPIVAPEVEFYLVAPNTNPDYPVEPPVGRSGRPEPARRAYSIDAVNEFEDFFEETYAFAEIQGLQIETLTHEDGVAQMEVNFLHGEPLDLADQMFLFKRTVREAAVRHQLHATFMAKASEKQPGSSMHLHHSVLDKNTGKNIFADDAGEMSATFNSFIAGLQRYLPAAMPLFAPNVNSYRRIARYSSAPINTHWGHDNRTAGLRIPRSDATNLRIENRVPGADVNPYLAIAASLAAGLLGVEQDLQPSEPLTTSAYTLPYGLPRHLEAALQQLAACEPMCEILGRKFVKAYSAVKEAEYEAFFRVISSWEREHLLFNV